MNPIATYSLYLMLDLMFDIHGLFVGNYCKITIEIENVIANSKGQQYILEKNLYSIEIEHI